MVPGAFVRVMFPTRERPRQPGLPPIGYIPGGTSTEIVVACTTSRPWPSGTPLPAGARLLDRAEAASLNQSRAFPLRLDVLAKPPMTEPWFPTLTHPGQGIIAVAPARSRKELTDLATHLARRRRDLIQMRGL